MVLLRGRSGAHQSIDGGGGGGGVNGTENEMAGLGRAHRGGDGLEVADLADHKNIRILAERGAQSGSEGGNVGADFALIDQAFLVGMNHFDRVLNGEDVMARAPIDGVDQGGQGGGLPRPRVGKGHY